MKEQIVNYNTAKLAYEKGFDEQCEKGYIEENLYLEFPDGGYYRNSDLATEWIKENYSHEYSAPTQSFLQRWLREEHNIDIIIERTFFGGHYYIRVLKTDKNGMFSNRFRITSDYIKPETYEEALELGLIKALKLIK